MNHERAEGLIADLFHDRLEKGAREDLVAHLAVCEECRAADQTYRLIAAAVNSEVAEDRSGDHPSSRSIVAHAVGTGDLDPEEGKRIAAHLQSCEACSREVDLTRQAETQLGPVPGGRSGPEQSRRFIARPVWTSLAACLALAALGYSAHLRFNRLPRLALRNRELAAAVNRAAPGGLVQSGYLSDTRSASVAQHVIPVGPDQSVVPFAVDPALLQGARAETRYRFELRSSDGGVIWSGTESPRREIRDSSTGPPVLLIPTAGLPSDPCSLVLVIETADGEDVLAERRVRFVTNPP